MSRNRWLVVVVLVGITLAVLFLIAIVVVRSYTSLSRPVGATFTLAPTSGPNRRPTATFPPTWTPIVPRTSEPTRTPKATTVPAPTSTPLPTSTPTPTPTATSAPTQLENPTFDGVLVDFIPGWKTGAFVNWASGQDFDKVASFAAPRFHQADDPRQWIDGPTLQIDTAPWVKLRAWVYQTVPVAPGSRVQFQIHAVGFVQDTAGRYILKAGVDPSGADGCGNARWGDELLVNQDDGVVVLTSPKVTAGMGGQVTVCAFAETQFAQVYHAAFFDDAQLEVSPPGGG